MTPRIRYFFPKDLHAPGFPNTSCCILYSSVIYIYARRARITCAAAAYQYDGARYATHFSIKLELNHAYTVIGPSSMQLSPMKTLVIITFLSTCTHVLCNMHWVRFFFCVFLLVPTILHHSILQLTVGTVHVGAVWEEDHSVRTIKRCKGHRKGNKSCINKCTQVVHKEDKGTIESRILVILRGQPL